MVGRSGERQVITAFVGALNPGARALVIEGEAGIGKTSLFNAALQVPGKPATALVACPVQAEAKLTHSALADLLEPIVAELSPRLPSPQRQALEMALFRVESRLHLSPQALSVAVLGMLRLQAQQGPILIAIDDLQWLDRGSQAVLAFALRRLRSEPVTLIATVRLGARPGDLPVLGSIPVERLRRLRLAPLSLAELHEMLQQGLSEPLPRATLRRIHEASGGNPYYALQLLSALRSVGLELAAGQPLPLPETLDGLLVGRLDHLPERAKEIVLAASVLARPTEQAVVGMAGGSETAHQAVGRAVTAKILTHDGDRLRFTHPLLASTAYGRESPEERRRLHARAAAVVVQEEERARHLALAASGPDEGVASDLESAARTARSRGGPLGAAELLELAVMLTPTDSAADRLRRMVDAGVSYLDAGDTDRAAALLEEAARRSIPGPQRAEVWRQLAIVRSLSQNWPATVELLTEAWAEAEAQSLLKAELALDLAFASVVVGDIPGAFDRSQDALQIVDQPEAEDLRATAQAVAAFCSFLLGRGLDLPLIEQAVQAEEQGEQSWHFIMSPRALAGISYKFVDQFDAARELFSEELQLLRANGDERKLPLVLYHLAELECWSGNCDLAGAYATEADELVSFAGQHAHRVVSLYASALVAAHRGRSEDALAKAEECLQLAMGVGNVAVMQQALSVLGFTELARGNPVAAHSHLGSLADSISAVGLAEPGVVRFLPDEIEALVALGQLDHARRLLESFEERARALERTWALATGARCRGLLLAAEGRIDEALSALEEALSWHVRLPMPLELGRSLLVKGEIERRARRRRLASETLKRAVSIFASLGAAVWEQRARTALARVGGVRPLSGELTASERRVAELVAAGLSNKQIASRLFISVNTVQTTLRHVFRKLGVRSRGELAARVAASRIEPKDH